MGFRSTSVAMCAAVPLAVAGCSGGGAPPAPPAAPPAPPAHQQVGADKVAWTNQLCGLVGGFMIAQQNGPKVDKTDTEKFKASSIAQIDSAEKTANQTLDGLRAIGPAPVAGADHLTEAFEGSFAQVRDILHAAKTKAEGVNAADQRAFAEGMVGVQQELKKGEQLSFSQQFAELERSPELRAAAEQAQSCQALMSAAQKSAQPPQAPQPPR